MIQPAPSSASANAGLRIATAASRVFVGPVGDEPLDLGLVHRVRELGVRAQRRVLGEWDRIVRPRPVDRRARDDDDLLDARAARRVEQATRRVDVDARGLGLVDLGTRREREVHERVGRLQQRGGIGEGQVEAALLGLRESGTQLGDVDRDDPRDAGILLQPSQHSSPDGASSAGDDDRSAVETAL